MSCYHPLVGIPCGINENGKQRIVIKKDWLKYHKFEELEKWDGILIPCGHCIGCRLDYSRSWADRMMLELEIEKKGIFLTLTYNNENCPWVQYDEDGMPMYATLEKRDWQLFMKRLRKEYEKYDIKLRFYVSGEYGTNTLRPHYHAIIFGIGLYDIDDCKPIGRNDIRQPYYVSEKIQKIWNRGHILITDVSYETCAYVARYVTKKLSGEMKIEYAKRNVIPEFSLMSRKPGIGANYLLENPDCIDFKKINLTTPNGGKQIAIPKYYLKKLEKVDKKKYDDIMKQRKRFASDSMLIELQKTELPFLEYLEVKEEARKAKIKVLNRKG